ncbi:MAG TPA: sulfatase-like hydrolase/transferase, partial [Tepidisphaeraceae bacterium]|nr:sulfatase-like hydrolase/transferase [Tepidisphaeraceae bacterium]
TRASIITGMYPSQHGAWSLGTKLFEDVPTLGGYLSEAGYYTSLIGKAHFQPTAQRQGMESIECHPLLRDLDYWRGFHGPWYGFDHIEIARMHGNEHLVGQHYAIWLEENGLKDWQKYFDPWPTDRAIHPDYGKHGAAWDLPEQFHYSRWTAQRSIAQIELATNHQQPFFLWASFHDPHPPYIVPEPWASMYDPADMPIGRLVPGEHQNNPPHFSATQEPESDHWKRTLGGEGKVHGSGSHLHTEQDLRKNMAIYYGMISLMDQQIGRILDALDRTGQADNTLVVFTSDHGHFLGQHGLTEKAIHHYEDLLRVPFIVRHPGHVPAGRTSTALQNLVDLAPTFLTAAELPVPGPMTGLNQLPSWQGGQPVRTYSVTENHHGNRIYHMRSYVNQRYKITVYRDGPYGELFDLQQDPQEVRNLWNDPSAQSLKCELLLEFMQATLRDEPMRMPRIAGA